MTWLNCLQIILLKLQIKICKNDFEQGILYEQLVRKGKFKSLNILSKMHKIILKQYKKLTRDPSI